MRNQPQSALELSLEKYTTKLLAGISSSALPARGGGEREREREREGGGEGHTRVIPVTPPPCNVRACLPLWPGHVPLPALPLYFSSPQRSVRASSL